MKPRTWKKIGIILGSLVLVLIIIGIVTPMLLDLNRYHSVIVSQVEKAVGGQVTLGHISWGIAHRIWLKVDGFSISAATAFPGDINLTRMYASVSIPPLLTGKIVLQNLQLESAAVKFRLEPQTKDAGPPADNTKSAGVQLPVEIEIQKLAVAIKRFELVDALSLPGQTLVYLFSDIDLAAANLAPEKVMAFNLSLQDSAPAGIGSLRAQGTFSGLTKNLTLENPDLKLKAALNAFNLDAVKPYLTNDRLKNQLGGSISLEINYQGDLGQNLQARGVIDLGQLTYTNPSLWDSALPGRNTTVTFQINLDPQNLTVEKFGLKQGALALDARGLLHNWNTAPVIKNVEFSSDLPLAGVIPLIPWKQLGDNAAVIRPILEGGGKITISKAVLPEISLTRLPENLAALMPGIEMTARITGVSMQPTPKIPKIQNIEGTVQLAKGAAQVQGLTARIASVALPPVSARITQLLEKPKIEAAMIGRLLLDATADEELLKLLEIIGMQKVVGTIDLDLTVELETARPADFQLRGNAGLKDFEVKTVYTPALFQGLNARATIEPGVVTLSQASAIIALPAAGTSADEQFTLDIQGKVDDWQHNPSVTLQNVKTSQIYLPLLSSMVPWEKLGQSAQPAKKILDTGGFITIEALSLPEISLSRLPKDPKQLLPRVELVTRFTDITVPRGLSPAKIEELTGKVFLAKNVLVAENVQARLGPIALPVLNMRATDITDQFKLSLRAKGPLKTVAAGNAQAQKLLLEYGLKSLAVSANIDMRADFDQRKPDDWTADGSLVIDDARARTHPAAVVLDGLKGQVIFSREKTMNITARDMTVRINRAPVRLSGRILGIGSPKMLVSAKAYAGKVNLSHLAELLPPARKMQLKGLLDMDVDVHVPYAAPAKTRLKGTVTTRDAGFRLAASNLAVAKGDLNLKLSGSSAHIKTMSMQVNDQNLSLSGQVSNPVEPNIIMRVTSPDLNLDRFLPPYASKGKDDRRAQKPSTDQRAGKSELPTLARKLTADLKVRADQGRYKGLRFEKLNLDLLYKQGVIESYDLNFGIDNGSFATKGSADLRDLDHIGFSVAPDIRALPLASVTPALGIDNLPLNGPLTLKGQLQGRTGSTTETLASLEGKLDASLGPGILNRVGKAGEMFAKLFSMANIRSLFSGGLLKDLSDRGIPFETISAQTSFDKGSLNISQYHFGSNAMTVDGQGKIDLIHQNLKMDALLVPLATVDKALNYVPLVGKALADVTRIRIDIEGPLAGPRIRTAQARQIGKGLETGVKESDTLLEDIGKGLKKIF